MIQDGNIIDFEYRSSIQARWLDSKSRKTGRDILELAFAFGEKLAKKIDEKYITLKSTQLKGINQ